MNKTAVSLYVLLCGVGLLLIVGSLLAGANPIAMVGFLFGWGDATSMAEFPMEIQFWVGVMILIIFGSTLKEKIARSYYDFL